MIGIANAFSGGVFITVAMLHLLPESHEAFEKIFRKERAFPIAFLLALFGYCLILMIEKVVFDSHSHGVDHMEEGHGLAEASHNILDSNELVASQVGSKSRNNLINTDLIRNESSTIPLDELHIKYAEDEVSVSIPQYSRLESSSFLCNISLSI